MNLREGTRRLALVLGVVGAIFGGFASYVELQSVLDQRASHNRFEQLANSEIVQQERKALQSLPDSIADIPPPPSGTIVVGGGAPKPKFTIGDAPPQPQVDWSKSIPIPSKVDKGGIGTINWGNDYGIESIVTQGGQTLYPTRAPSAWLYLLFALFPVFGFFIPWSAVSAIGWVGAGFVQPPK